jgi:hypothetical protein
MMQAVKKAGIKTHVVNSAFHDLVNPVLAKFGMVPTVWIGIVSVPPPLFWKTVATFLTL